MIMDGNNITLILNINSFISSFKTIKNEKILCSIPYYYAIDHFL